MKGKRAVVLAGGKGTRLRPYTIVVPKPLVPIGDFPILEIIIKQLASSGFDHVTLAVNHQAEIIMAFFQNGERWGITIDYSLEDRPLGTMGPLLLVKNLPKNCDGIPTKNCHVKIKKGSTVNNNCELCLSDRDSFKNEWCLAKGGKPGHCMNFFGRDGHPNKCNGTKVNNCNKENNRIKYRDR